MICIITHVQHIKNKNHYYGYGPYIREMNIWLNHVDEVILVAPLIEDELNPIYEKYNHSNLHFYQVQEFTISSLSNIFKTLIRLPKVFFQVYKAMAQSDHIHLRCPGNMGLIGAIVQILFPKKVKTAKYAGNWDPKSKQPWSYRLQKWLLSNTFLTRNMQVLVYGEWPKQTRNIKPFFTATYSENEILNTPTSPQKPAFKEGIKFLFVGTLSQGKQPLYAMQLVEKLLTLGHQVALDFYGEGVLRSELETYIAAHLLADSITLKGNQSKETLKEAYQNSHFLILPSKSEGWPKAVAEAMFWGCVPVATAVSCVPYMLDYGNRGVLLHEHLEKDTTILLDLLNDSKAYELKSKAAQNWSQHYTIELFEAEIKKLLAE